MAAPSRNAEYKRRYKRIISTALVASVLFHVAVVLWFRHPLIIPDSPFAAAGPRAGDDRAAQGGGMEAMNLQIVQPQPEPQVAEPEIPVPVPEPTPEIEVKVEQPQPQVVATVASAAVGVAAADAGRGTAVGAGVEGGTGRGDGGTTEEGLFRVVPPSPRGLILPPSDRPGKVRGKEVDVWVFVTSVGRVLPDSTRLAPPTGDRKFDNRLRDQAAEWVFEPAKKDGRPISEWFRYTIVL
jgi:outer membrane biosynthesis protein TonB